MLEGSQPMRLQTCLAYSSSIQGSSSPHQSVERLTLTVLFALLAGLEGMLLLFPCAMVALGGELDSSGGELSGGRKKERFSVKG